MTETVDDELRAVDGRVPGRRGRATRQRLLESTESLLASTSYRDLKVIDIARGAGTSPATFYQYFADVEAALLALTEELIGGSTLPGPVRDGAWSKQAYAAAVATVDRFLAFFQDNAAVLRVVDLLTAEGDGRFREMRTRLLNSVTIELAAVIEAEREKGAHPSTVHPMAHAGVLVAMLAHVAGHQEGFAAWGIGETDLRTSLARQLSWGVTGTSPTGA